MKFQKMIILAVQYDWIYEMLILCHGNFASIKEKSSIFVLQWIFYLCELKLQKKKKQPHPIDMIKILQGWWTD